MFVNFIIFCSLLSNIVLFIILYILKNKLDNDKRNFYKQISKKSDSFINTQRKSQIECKTLKKNIEDLNASIASLTKENNGLKERNKQLEEDSKVFDPEHKDLLKILHTFSNTFNDHIHKYNMHFTDAGECVYYNESDDNFYFYDDSEAVGALIDSLDTNNKNSAKSKGVSEDTNESSNEPQNNISTDRIQNQYIDDDEPIPLYDHVVNDETDDDSVDSDDED